MQNIVEANNKFEKFLMPIFTRLSVDNRIISNYRMLLNKEITNENIHEIKKRLNLYAEHLLDIIAYNLHKSEENHDNFLIFVNRRNLIKEFDMKKIEILFPKHCEMILKNSKNSCFNEDELAELDDLEAQIFAYIRLGNDCDILSKNINYKKSVTKSFNSNGLINNHTSNYNNNYNLKNKNFFEESTIPSSSNNNLTKATLANNNININNNKGNNNITNNYKNPFDCKSKMEFKNSEDSYKTTRHRFNKIEDDEAYLSKDKYNSIRDFYPAKKIDSSNFINNIQIKENLFIQENEKIGNQISNKKNNDNKNIFFEVVQGNNSIIFNGKENKIDKISSRELKKNKKNLITDANQTLNHFLGENLNEKNNYNKNELNSNIDAIGVNRDEIILNSNIYNFYPNQDYNKTSSEVDSYLNSEFIEITSSSANTNYYSNLNTFVEKTKTGLNLTPNSITKGFSANLQDFIMSIDDQKEIELFNPLIDIFKESKKNILNEFDNPVAIGKSKLNDHANIKAIKSNSFNDTKNLNKKKDLDLKCNQPYANIDIFFEKKNDNNDSTGGDFDREINSVDDFSHISSDVDNIKKEKSKNKQFSNQLEEQILKDPNSNFNYYSRQYIPKANKKSEKFKNMIPFLRDFNPKFLKKENIDKKILRKFRNFVKSFMENDLSSKIYSRIKSKDDLQKSISFVYDKFKDLIFLKKFYKQNLLPPMNYSDDSNNITIEFKSFNTNYMLWLFSQEGVGEIYKLFTDNLGHEILSDFVQSYNLELINKKSEIGIIQTLKDYIFSIEKIYTSSKSKNNLGKKQITLPTCVIKKDSINQTEYSLLNSDLHASTKQSNLITTDNQIKVCDQKKIVLDYEIVYQKNRSNTMTSEDIFDKCIDDLEIKNQAMILDFYNSKKEEKNKQLSKMLVNDKETKDLFKILDVEGNHETNNFNTDKKLIGNIVNDDQMYFEGLNNQQLENLNYFY